MGGGPDSPFLLWAADCEGDTGWSGGWPWGQLAGTSSLPCPLLTRGTTTKKRVRVQAPKRDQADLGSGWQMAPASSLVGPPHILPASRPPTWAGVISISSFGFPPPSSLSPACPVVGVFYGTQCTCL